jgi:hypothetical protein
MTETPWRGKRDELKLVNAEVDRELDDYTRREAAMQSRATILVGAASVVGALSLSDGFSWFTVVYLALSFVAAVLGLLVVFPRKGDNFNPRKLWDELYADMGEEEALHHTVRVKLENLEADDDSLRNRGKLARVGLIFLAVSILAAGLSVVGPQFGLGPSPAPTPTETHVEEG